jgi:Protein of unknown function (DUF3891)
VIVRAVEDGVVLITQPDHAHLARRVMEHCVPLEDHARRATILHAVGEHDCGWEEEDAAPRVDPETGAVFDFVSAPVAVRQAVWPRAVARLANEPWSAALVAQHALTVYDRFRPEPAWSSFFAELSATRDALLRATGLPLDHLLADYVFVRLGDLLSLAFCTRATGELGFGDWTVELSASRVVVSPDAFRGATVPFEIVARELPGALFRSDAELRDALQAANTIVLRGEAAGRPA